MSEERKYGEFAMDKVYNKRMSKKELVKLIKNCYDKEFMVVFLPTAKDKANFIIRSIWKEESGDLKW